MDKRKKVLFVEDIDSMRESYLANLRRENYRADGAGSLRSALEAIDRCTYHVAIVDIMLAGMRDTTNRDGVEVLKYLQQLGEGTRAIVLSGQDDLQLVSDSYSEHHVFGYILKKQAQKEGISLLLRTIEKALVKCPVDAPTTWTDLVKVIAWPMSEGAFVSECINRLEFKGAADTLQTSLLAACKPLVPLFVQNAVESALVFGEKDHVLRGNFWSKGQGHAVELLLWGKNAVDAEALTARRNIIFQREKGGLNIAVAELPGLMREGFARTQG